MLLQDDNRNKENNKKKKRFIIVLRMNSQKMINLSTMCIFIYKNVGALCVYELFRYNIMLLLWKTRRLVLLTHLVGHIF